MKAKSPHSESNCTKSQVFKAFLSAATNVILYSVELSAKGWQIIGRSAQAHCVRCGPWFLPPAEHRRYSSEDGSRAQRVHVLWTQGCFLFWGGLWGRFFLEDVYINNTLGKGLVLGKAVHLQLSGQTVLRWSWTEQSPDGFSWWENHEKAQIP